MEFLEPVLDFFFRMGIEPNVGNWLRLNCMECWIGLEPALKPTSRGSFCSRSFGLRILESALIVFILAEIPLLAIRSQRKPCCGLPLGQPPIAYSSTVESPPPAQYSTRDYSRHGS